VSSREVYGRLLAAPTVERGVEVCLRYRMGDYLGEVLEQAGYARDTLPDPQDLARVSDVVWPVETTTAVVIVATPGTSGDANREPDGYRVTWDVRVGVIADLGDRLDTREAAQFYAAAAGAALSHQGVAAVDPDGVTWTLDVADEPLELEGSSVRWLGESYRVADRRDARTLIVGEARVAVTVEGARSAVGGPLVAPEVPRDPAVPGVAGPVVPHVTVNGADSPPLPFVEPVPDVLVQVGHGPPTSETPHGLYVDQDTGELYNWSGGA
jgi:hypothetical protein